MRPRPLSEEQHVRPYAALGPDGERLAAGLQQGLPAIPLTGFPSLTSAFANDVDPLLGSPN